jgi:hypothetical protein
MKRRRLGTVARTEFDQFAALGSCPSAMSSTSVSLIYMPALCADRFDAPTSMTRRKRDVS